MPIVSVIIPTYNRTWGLKRAVESVLAQSFTDFELLIIDDASENETSRLVGALTDSRIRYVRQERNVGVAENWGTGLRLARGTFVAWLMDDDRYEPPFLANRVAALEENPNAVLAFSGYKIFNEKEQRVVDTMLPKHTRAGRLEHTAAFKSTLIFDVFIGASLYRTEQARKTWPLVERYGEIVDYALNVQLTAQPDSEAALIETSDFVMSSHPDQLSNLRREKAFRLTADFLDEMSRTHSLNDSDASLLRRQRAAWQMEWGKYDRVCGRRASAWRKWLQAVGTAPTSSLPYRTAASWLLRDFGLRRDQTSSSS